MARIEISNFGGIIPSRDSAMLPDNAAQIAHNVDLSGGTLKPWRTVNDFRFLHDGTGMIPQNIKPEDIAIYHRPPKVELHQHVRMCRPYGDGFGWITITAYGYFSQAQNSPGGALKSVPVTVGGIEFSDTGFDLHCTFPDMTWGNVMAGYFYLAGPYYRFAVSGTSGRAFSGGPKSGRALGADATAVLEKENISVLSYPNDIIPLYYPTSMEGFAGPDTATSPDRQVYQYASAQCVEVSNPITQAVPKIIRNYDLGPGEFMAPGQTATIKGGKVKFSFLCNYVQDRSRQDYYCVQYVDNHGRDGQASPVSDPIVTPPGCVSILKVPVRNFIRRNWETGRYYEVTHLSKIFRSSNAEGGFGAIADNCAPLASHGLTGTPTLAGTVYHGYVDNFRQPIVETLPPNGRFMVGDEAAIPWGNAAIVNYNPALDDADQPANPLAAHLQAMGRLTTILRGAIRHPAGYTFFYNGKDLRPSSEWINLERPWATPREYAHTFDSEIQCLALLEGTLLVFTQTAVYKVHGQHPARLAIYRISDKPILSNRTLWSTFDMVGWCNEEGIAVFDGNTVQLLTGEYFRANQWKPRQSADYYAQTHDKTMCLFGPVRSEMGVSGKPPQQNNLRFDMRGAREAAISTFDSHSTELSPGTGFTVPQPPFDSPIAGGQREPPANPPHQFIWRSKTFHFPKAMSWYAARVVADEYPVAVSLYSSNQWQQEAAFFATSPKEILLPRTPASRHWEFAISGSTQVRSFTIGTSIAEVQ